MRQQISFGAGLLLANCKGIFKSMCDQINQKMGLLHRVTWSDLNTASLSRARLAESEFYFAFSEP